MKKSFWSGVITGIFAALIVTAASVWVTGLVITHNNSSNTSATATPAPTASASADATATPTPTPDYDVSGDTLSSTFLTKMQLLADIIDKYYYKDVDVTTLQDGLYHAIMSSIGDPYTVYYTKEEYDSFSESTSGTYCGIGAQVSQNVSTMVITVVTAFKGCPAAQAGMKAGDRIIAVDGEDVTNMELSLVVAKMKGEKGTQVVVTVYRETTDSDGTTTAETIDMTITRDEIEVPTVEYEMKDDHIGYIAVSSFDSVTAKQFKAAYDDLESQGMTSLIIDLRNNLGGLLSICVEMADYMLPEGDLITYTQDKQGQGSSYKSDDGHQCDLPVVILTNGYSASASEVFTGALKDNGVAISMGTTTFGKGIVQSLIPLSDGSAVKLTTSSYYTPSGVCIHGIGIDPDVEVILGTEYDNQLEAALDRLNNK